MTSERTTIRSGKPAGTKSRTAFGNRRKLFADLDEALAAEDSSKLIVLVEFVGLKLYAEAVGQAASEELVTRLGDRLVAVVGTSGSCYSLRRAELCALIDDSVSGRAAFLETLAMELGESAHVCEISPAFGTALVPDEAADSLEALELADQRLNFQKLARDPDPNPGRHSRLVR